MTVTRGGRHPASAYDTPSRAAIFTDPSVQREKVRRAAPEAGWGFGVGRVVSVDADSYTMTLQVVMGASDDQERLPVPIPFPAAGRAQILGGLPMLGDYCVVGWMPMETAAPRTRTPVVIGWVLPGLYPALAGAATALLGPEEADVEDPTTRQALGALGAHRHRTIPLEPGNLVGAAAQGADWVLDDGVQLASRRGTGLWLRDTDQLLLQRSVSSQHAHAGARVYAGAVRRDALLPPPDMRDNDAKDGPAPPGAQPDGTGVEPMADLLSRAGLVDAQVRWVPEVLEMMAAAGTYRTDEGRWVHLVPAGEGDPAADPGESCWAEWRVEVARSARPRLPATDVADGFDAERLPDAAGNNPPERPVVRMSLGAAVGNDPYGDGRALYGAPLKATVFSGSLPAPGLSAMDAGDVSEHPDDVLAFLLEVESEQGTSFAALDRAGRARAFLGGAPAEDGVQVRSAGGIRVSAAGRLRSEAEGGIEVRDLSSLGVLVASDTGPVQLRGGGPGSAPGSDPASTPAIALDAEGDLRLRAAKRLMAMADQLLAAASSLQMSADLGIDLSTGGRLALSCKDGTAVYGSTCGEEFSGPKGPLHKRHYSPTIPNQVCEDVSYEMGDRSEVFKQGSHKTQILVGNASYEVVTGNLILKSAENKVALSASGITMSAAAGTVSVSADVGSASVSGTSASLEATGGMVTVHGQTGVLLRGLVVGPDVGPIVCAGSIEPASGKPFTFFGVGAKNHIVSP